MKHAIIPFQPNDIGSTFENLVYNHLVTAGYQVYVGKHQSREIDFVAIKNEQTKLLADEKVRAREFGNLLKITDNYEKMVISADEFIQGNYKGVKHKHILDFLAEPLEM